jgi:iron-sulfur cluster repair protein YtfE (RIC family)
MKDTVEALLEDDHESLGRLLNEVDAELGKPDITAFLKLLDRFWARLAVHIRAENLHLFPALSDASPPLFTGEGNLPTAEEAHDIILRLSSDHSFFMRELASIMKAARECVERKSTPPEKISEWRDVLTGISERLDAHNRLEEEQVYLWPSILFDEKTVASLRARIQHELQNLPPRLAET